MKFEKAVLKALGTLPGEYWQRKDGLMCEHVVLELYPHWFPSLRLWLMEKRGLIESSYNSNYVRGGCKSYRLKKEPKVVQ